MKLQNVMLVNSVVAFVLGVALALWGPGMLSFYGLASLPQEHAAWFWTAGTLTRLFGITLIGFGFIAWAAGKFADSPARWDLTLAFFLANGIGFIIALIQQLSIAGSPLGWIAVVVYLALALAFGYLLVKQTSTR